MPFPAAKRAIDEARQAIINGGHEVVELKIDQNLINRLCDSFFKVTFMNHKERVEEVQGEMVIPEFLAISIISFFPYFVRSLVANIAKLLGQSRLQKLMSIPIIDNSKLLL